MQCNRYLRTCGFILETTCLDGLSLLARTPLVQVVWEGGDESSTSNWAKTATVLIALGADHSDSSPKPR
jgi:hypothetical protein